MAHGLQAKLGELNGIISESRKPGEARRPHLFFMGSRAIPGGPKQHTSVVEEAWRGQEAS